MTPGIDSPANALTAFFQKPPKRRRSSLRASLEIPVTVPLSVNPTLFNIDELSVALIRSPSPAICSAEAICGNLRKLQILRAAFSQCPFLAAPTGFKVTTTPARTRSTPEQEIDFLPLGDFQGTWPKYQLRSKPTKRERSALSSALWVRVQRG